MLSSLQVNISSVVVRPTRMSLMGSWWIEEQDVEEEEDDGSRLSWWEELLYRVRRFLLVLVAVDAVGLSLLSSSMEVKVDPMVVVSCDVELLQSPMRYGEQFPIPGCLVVG